MTGIAKPLFGFYAPPVDRGAGTWVGTAKTIARGIAEINQMLAEVNQNCGGILDGTESIDEIGARIFKSMLECASGTKSNSELLGYGQNEFVPWQIGAGT